MFLSGHLRVPPGAPQWVECKCRPETDNRACVVHPVSIVYLFDEAREKNDQNWHLRASCHNPKFQSNVINYILLRMFIL